MERIRAAKKMTKNVDITKIRNVTYGAIFTFLTMFCNTIAFSTPNWLAADGRQPIKRFNKLGLWEACFHQFRDPYYLFEREFRGCKWIFDEDFAFMIDFLEPGKLPPFLFPFPVRKKFEQNQILKLGSCFLYKQKC